MARKSKDGDAIRPLLEDVVSSTLGEVREDKSGVGYCRTTAQEVKPPTAGKFYDRLSQCNVNSEHRIPDESSRLKYSYFGTTPAEHSISFKQLCNTVALSTRLF